MIRKILTVVIILIIVISLGSLIYLSIGHYDASETSISKFDSSFVTSRHYASENDDASVGYIFYPGAKVDYRSYSYLANKDDNIQIFIADFPFEIAFFNSNIAQEIIDDNPNIENFYIGGHSLGGVVASNYYENNLELFDGVILLASYPSSDLSSLSRNYLGIFAENDGLVTDISAKQKLYPQNSTFKIIKGGNHGQFGDYGSQKKDNDAKITSKEQHDIINTYIYNFIFN